MARTTGLPFLPHVTARLVVVVIVMAGLWSQTGPAAADPNDATAESNVYLVQDNFQAIAGNQATEDNSSQTANNLFSGSQDNTAASGEAAGYATARSYAIVIQTNVQVIAGWNCGVDQTAANVAGLDQNATALDGYGYGYAMAINLAIIMQTNTQIYVCTGLDGGGGEQTAVNVAGVGQSADAATVGGPPGAEESTTGGESTGAGAWDGATGAAAAGAREGAASAIAGTEGATATWGAAAGTEQNAGQGSGAEASWDTLAGAAGPQQGATPGGQETSPWAEMAQALATAWANASVFNIALLNQDNFQLTVD
jgi:hypothetical protein